ncbi:MAG: bifunctional oligoribonuclease/PAP phosphatase NrnA [Deltaproteobacteria bacterium]|nr:bifunctional oligoribonuclease/PAP phosphatase NrnA [Deltaproteobacteria bacterium]
MGIFDQAVEEARRGRKFLVVSHVSPEGDAIGSLLGMALALKGMGKDVTAYLEDPVPDIFSFLPGVDTIVHGLDGAGPFDATFAVDCGQKERLGRGFLGLKEPGRIINIDHHATNDCFGDVNVIVPDASAAGELVYDFCKAASVDVTRAMAINLYVAILTDTGSFRYSSATADAFIKAGELVKLGAEPWEISRRVYENHPVRRYKLLGMVLSTLELTDLGNSARIATLTVTLDMFRKAGAEKDIADGFVNYARGIEGVEVGMLFRETGPKEYKVSLRSKGDVDVAEVSKVFGGGGHRNAAGFTLKGTIEEVKAKIMEAIREKVFAAHKV